jgi:hypothetical protein
MIGDDAYFASGNLPSDYAWLRFVAQCTGGMAVGVLGEIL